MSQIDALQLSQAVKRRLVDFALDSNFSRDPALTEVCRRIWSETGEHGGLVSQLWVEGVFPALASEASTGSLAEAGAFNPDLCAHLHQNGAIPRDRLLYHHQHRAVAEGRERGPGGERPALVVTAGTGAGKTESFLLPILDELFAHPEGDDSGHGGIKCLILYPMNALVNDQMDRLYSWLKGQKRVTLFHFTSETPEDYGRIRDDRSRDFDACRFRTRQQARGLETAEGKSFPVNTRGPVPDIVVTNYSMLEYMLCRPQDAVFFGPALRALVLDEAHLYTGTLAAEITLLLRRLYERCGVDANRVLQVATSATLGTEERHAELRGFIAKLFSKRPPLVRVISGKRTDTRLTANPAAPTPSNPSEFVERRWLQESTLADDGDGKVRFAEFSSPARAKELAGDLCIVAGETAVTQAEAAAENRPAVLLWHALECAPIFARLSQILWDKERLSLTDLSEQLWGENHLQGCEAATHLLRMGASARAKEGDFPRVPHRIHLLARPASGLSACLNVGGCSAEPARRLQGLGGVSAGGQSRCPDCDGATLSICRCDGCGEWGLAGMYERGRYAPANVLDPEKPMAVLFSPRPLEDGAVTLYLDPTTGEETAPGKGIKLHRVDGSCPVCDEDANQNWHLLRADVPVTLSVLTETALAELPPFPSPSSAWLPAAGRRLLAFSDSRTEAARLGPRLTRQHELQLFRAVVAQALKESPTSDPEHVADLKEERDRLHARLGELLSPARRQTTLMRMAEVEAGLREAQAGGAVSLWAKVLGERPELEEILDAATSREHRADRWDQRKWEDNLHHIQAAAVNLLGRELARPAIRQINLQAIGLAEITYPGIDAIPAPDALLGQLVTEAARDGLRTNWGTFLALLCDSLRTDSAVTLGSPEQDEAYFSGRLPIGSWASLDHKFYGLVRFLGTTPRQSRRRFGAALLEKFGYSAERAEEAAPDLLRTAFDALHTSATAGSLPWLDHGERQTERLGVAKAIRIRFPQLGLRRPTTLWQCAVTGNLWTRQISGTVPSVSTVRLREKQHEELDGDPRVGRARREFQGRFVDGQRPVFSTGLWAEEHSAQLAPEENRRLQDLFKAGVRNVLSSTTTLELGIDIGGLNAVLMGNVPPGKANYLQRAGRAGRRADGSSIVLTLARPRPFDREVFHRFGDYLGRPLRQPQVFLDRRRIIQRHVHALLLGEFFRRVYGPNREVGAMRAFGDMGVFCRVTLPPKWDRTSPQRPPASEPMDTKSAATGESWWQSASGTALEEQFQGFLQWIQAEPVVEGKILAALTSLRADTKLMDTGIAEVLRDAATAFSSAVKEWREDYDPLLLAWLAFDPQNAKLRRHANALRYQMSAFYGMTVIEALADRQFLPRYGFPIGLLKLRVVVPEEDRPQRTREEDQFRLERPGLLAIGEYVPGSQMLVGGRLITSRGLLKHWSGANLDNAFGLQGLYAKCPHGHFFYDFNRDANELLCPLCGERPAETPTPFIVPRHGFTTAAWDPPRLTSEVERVGRVARETCTFVKEDDLERRDSFGEVTGLRAFYRADGELLVYNAGEHERGFAICPRCGFAESEGAGKKRGDPLPNDFLNHLPLDAAPRRPNGQTPNRCPLPPADALRHRSFAARETTDVLMLDFSAADARAGDQDVAHTLARALQIAGAKRLDLDSREIGSFAAPAGQNGTAWGAVLYDNVPGGAGHVQELLTAGRPWLEEARAALWINETHDRLCEDGCLDCVLTFDLYTDENQRHLRRRLAREVLDGLLHGRPMPQPVPVDPSKISPAPPSSPVATEQRVAQAKSKLAARRQQLQGRWQKPPG